MQRPRLHCLDYIFHRTFKFCYCFISIYAWTHYEPANFQLTPFNNEIVWRVIATDKEDDFEIIYNNVLSYKQVSSPLIITYHGTLIRTGITCKKIPCYSACRWFIVKNVEIFWSYVKHFWIFPRERSCRILIGLCK